MRAFLRTNSAIFGAAAVAAALGAVGFSPLFGGPGYEIALAAGLVVPSVTAVTTAIELSGEWSVDGPPARPAAEPFDAFCRGVAIGATFAAIGFATTLLHALRAGVCDLAQGAALYVLGPLVGAMLAGAWGAAAAEIARPRAPAPFSSASGAAPKVTRRRRALAVALALAAPLLSIAIGLSRFYSSPMIYAYDPFVGYFSGTLYDTVIDTSGLLSYRAASLATLFAGFVAALHLAHDADGRLAFQAIGRPGLLVFGGAALFASGASIVEGNKLHHWSTASSITADLGGFEAGDRCDVVYPRAMGAEAARRLLGECEAHVAAGEAWFGTAGPPKITAYVFDSPAQKALLMGAAETNIAKPWRHEVYVQASGYPHPVIGHEIMHVLASSVGHGPLRIAGSLGGVLPNPGLIEGVAVAAAPPDGELTPREWAKAMKDLGLLPPLKRLFGLGFLGENASTAYTVSGAFVGFVHARFGSAAVNAWYGGAPLDAVTSTSWAELEAKWHEDLDRVTLPEATKAVAKARFDRPAVFGRRCPHVVDGCKEKADRLRSAGDERAAIDAYAQVLALDPSDFAAKLGKPRALQRAGDVAGAKAGYQALADDSELRVVQRDRAREELADLALATGDADAAVRGYRDVMPRVIDEDELRTLEVKIAAAAEPRARRAVVAQLIGEPGHAIDRFLAAELLGAWSEAAPNDGLPLYLLGRHLYSSGNFIEARDRLDRALATRIAIARVEIEAERLRVVVACATGDVAAARRWFGAYAAHPSVSAARREATERLLERCTRGSERIGAAPPSDSASPSASASAPATATP